MKTLHHSFSRITQMGAVIALLCYLVLPTSAQGPLFSQYGYQNLSYESGVPNTVAVYKVETAIDGDILHLLWVEDEDASFNNRYRLWYRQSKDLGLTWEKPVEIMTIASYEWRKWKFMSAADSKVYFVVPDGDSLVCLTTTNGQNFQRQILHTKGQHASFVKAVGSKVAVCYQSKVDSWKNIHIAYSENDGVVFDDNIVTCTYGDEGYTTNLISFDFDGTTMAALTKWNDRWYENCMLWAISSTDGKTFNSIQLASGLTKDDGTIYHNGYQAGAVNGGAHEAYAHIAISDHCIYALTTDQLTNDDDKRYLTLHRSVDGGQTWAEPQQVCTDLYKPKNYCNAYIKANGSDVYILTDIDDYGQYEIRNLIFHSTDRGQSFECQTDWTETIHNRGHISDYTLSFDHSDKKGKTIYLAGNDYSWVKTTDGFATIDEVSMNDNSCPDGVGFWENLYTNLEIDDNGVKHWFIRYRPNGAERHEIIYRRETSEPTPGTVDKALAIAPLTEEGYVQNRVLIPNNQNFHGTAMTMEMWVKSGDTENDLTFTYLSHNSSQAQDYGIWFGLDDDYWFGNNWFTAGLCNDKDDLITLTCKSQEMIPDQWYHLALTYDEATHKACFYVNGVLADEKDFHGAIGWGWNPIVIGNPMDWTSKVAYFVDDFRLWNRALSASEIQENMYRPITTADGLKVNLGFNDTLLDLSGNGNSGYGMANVNFTDSERATGIHSPKSPLSLTRRGENSYDVLLPVTAMKATMKVYDNAGRELQSQSLGSGSQFNIVIQACGTSILVIEADGKMYVWKLASN